jgi:hypothetical protein
MSPCVTASPLLLIFLRNMSSGTAENPIKEALLNHELNPVKGASDSVSGSASEAVLLCRLVGVEAKAELTDLSRFFCGA